MAEQGMREATPPPAEKSSHDPQLKALHDSVSKLMDRLDALTKRFNDDDDRKDRRRDSRKDAEEMCDDDDDRRDARSDESEEEEEKKEEKREDRRDDDDRKDAKRRDRADKEFKEWAKEEEDEPEHKEEKDDSARGDEDKGETEAEPMASDKRKDDDDDDRKDDRRRDARSDRRDDDDDRKDDRRDDRRRDSRSDRRDDDDDHRRDSRSDDRRRDSRSDDDDRRDDRRDSRADARMDSALFRRLEELERNSKRLEALERDRMRSDEDVNRIADLQSEWSKIALAHGDRRSMQPGVGESPTAYDRRHAQFYRKFSPQWSKVNLREVPLSVLEIAAPIIRKDAMSAAYTTPASSTPMQREVKETDRTGRQISRFVGPVDAINGMMTPFMLPRMRARIIPPSQQGVF